MVSKAGIVWVCLWVSCALLGCDFSAQEENPCEDENTLYLDGEFASMNYGEGSFWVMQDQVSGTLDSLSVLRFEHGFMTNVQCGNPVIETFRYIVQFHFGKTELTFLLTPRGLQLEPDATGQGVCVFFGTEDHTAHPAHVELFSEMWLEGHRYEDVSMCRVEHDPTRGGLRTDYYINAQDGFLRIKRYGINGSIGEDLMLKRSSILR
jgi:hypothetical protein